MANFESQFVGSKAVEANGVKMPLEIQIKEDLGAIWGEE